MRPSALRALVLAPLIIQFPLDESLDNPWNFKRHTFRILNTLSRKFAFVAPLTDALLGAILGYPDLDVVREVGLGEDVDVTTRISGRCARFSRARWLLVLPQEVQDVAFYFVCIIQLT